MPINALQLQTGDSTGRSNGLAPIEQTRPTTAAAVTEKVGFIRDQVKVLDGDTRDLHERALVAELEQLYRTVSKKPVSDLLAVLSDSGFAWRDVARMVGVSVPALQKWRRGENITGENRLKLAKVVSIVEMVRDRMLVSDPASWFEMPVREGVGLNPIDLVAAGREPLVFELATDHSDALSVLEQFDPEWRSNLVDSAFETYVDRDGVRSIRPRQRAR